MKTIKTDNYVVTIDDSQEVKDAIFERLIKFGLQHDAWTGESIFQSDEPNIDSVSVMCEIFDDIMKSDITWNE